MGRYMNDYADSLGGDLSYEWKQSGVVVGFGSSSQLDTVREDTDKFGLKVSSGICVDVNWHRYRRRRFRAGRLFHLDRQGERSVVQPVRNG